MGSWPRTVSRVKSNGGTEHEKVIKERERGLMGEGQLLTLSPPPSRNQRRKEMYLRRRDERSYNCSIATRFKCGLRRAIIYNIAERLDSSEEPFKMDVEGEVHWAEERGGKCKRGAHKKNSPMIPSTSTLSLSPCPSLLVTLSSLSHPICASLKQAE